MRDSKDLEKIKRELVARRTALLKQLEEIEQESDANKLANPDRSDLAWRVDQRSRKSVLQEQREQNLRQIEEALQRLQEGSYGSCANCGQSIQAERLQVKPEANFCIKCQQNQALD
jgi:DnaK suppressor protein